VAIIKGSTFWKKELRGEKGSIREKRFGSSTLPVPVGKNPRAGGRGNVVRRPKKGPCVISGKRGKTPHNKKKDVKKGGGKKP